MPARSFILSYCSLRFVPLHDRSTLRSPYRILRTARTSHIIAFIHWLPLALVTRCHLSTVYRFLQYPPTGHAVDI